MNARSMNVEVKVRVPNTAPIRALLRARNAVFKGLDHQTDTYFSVPDGRPGDRLKVREGTVESCLVHYVRPNEQGARRCDYTICRFAPGDSAAEGVKRTLASALGVVAVVEKHREIYILGRLKCHLDELPGLGSFFEIEAVSDGVVTEDDLRAECGQFLEECGLSEDDGIDCSYLDMVTGGS